MSQSNMEQSVLVVPYKELNETWKHNFAQLDDKGFKGIYLTDQNLPHPLVIAVVDNKADVAKIVAQDLQLQQILDPADQAALQLLTEVNQIVTKGKKSSFSGKGFGFAMKLFKNNDVSDNKNIVLITRKEKSHFLHSN